ncbi:MAG: hypothetical protein ABI405_01960 [Parafilimonas sp.]
MEFSELRIGNFFKIRAYYDDTGTISKVTEINTKQIYTKGKWFNFNELIPISITEDILLQSGFTHFDWLPDYSVFECHHFKCTLDKNGVHLFCDNLKNLKPLKYLHELQNLYFDLTGEELETKLNNIKTRKTEMV